MVVTRSQGDKAELGERRSEQLTHIEEEARRVEHERVRRLTMEPPASPSSKWTSTTLECHTRTTAAASTSGTVRPRERRTSPTQSIRSHRSTMSVSTRLRMAELEAAERLAAIQRKELDLEAELVRKRLAAEVSIIQDDQESIHEEPIGPQAGQQRIHEWLRSDPRENAPPTHRDEHRDEHRNERTRSPTPTRGHIQQLTEALQKMSRPRVRPTELPTFSGDINEWLPFKAAMRDSTKLYDVSAAENLQRLRSCLKGDARDAVAALLHSATDPELIMKTLEHCFGKPEIIINKAFEDLRRLPRLGSSAVELNKFAVQLQNVVYVLKTIDKRGYLFNPALTQDILEKLSPHIKMRWCDYAVAEEDNGDPEIVMLSRFLMREADRALRYSYAPAASTSVAPRKETPAPAKAKKRHTIYTMVDEESVCPECQKDHRLLQCPVYKNATVQERWNLVKKNKLCFKCVERKHWRGNCRTKSCGINQCKRPHHSSLHTEERRTQENPNPPEAVLSVDARRNTHPRTVLLKMCPVVIVGPRGEIETHALLDEGATITLIDEAVARSIGAEGPTKPLQLFGVNMRQHEERSQLVNIQLRGAHETTRHNVKARTVKNLRLHKQTVVPNINQYAHLRDLRNEEICYDSARPGILLGADHWELIVSRELRIGKPNEPAASKTQLGWVIHGTMPRRSIVARNNVLHTFHHVENQDDELHEEVKFHFKIDALGVAPKPRHTDAERRAIAIVSGSIRKYGTQYEVGLPWRHDDVNMPPNYDMALRRLWNIEKKMDKNVDFGRAYMAQIEHLINQGYAEQCDGSESASPVSWYLPHFAVYNAKKPGKIRVVFDAAAVSGGTSLNEQLLEGPDMLMSLPGILFRFRERAVAVTADIREMFLRIRIRQGDQPAQQFLWRGMDRSSPPKRYKMTSMIFGAASSPFMAHYVRNHNADAHAERYPMALTAIKKSHYMDDYVASYDTTEEAQRAIQETTTVHAAAGFTLRQWNTNCGDVLKGVPKELRASSSTTLGGDEGENKILGLVWDAEEDKLGFNTCLGRVPAAVRDLQRSPSKREALSAVMSIYDPLGLISQYTIRAKIVLQRLWQIKISWDDPIPDEEGEEFATWISQLDAIRKVRLPRFYEARNSDRTELHIFCDASEQAYATAAYWRVTDDTGGVHVALVAAKAKVAPIRTQTIPRLELQAALIGARLADHVKREHTLRVDRTIYWTDSSTVIHWIRNGCKKNTPFVTHRLAELDELSNTSDWRWLPTTENVADDATRTSHAVISTEDRWFKGPEFLQQPEAEWPQEEEVQPADNEVAYVCNEADKGWLPNPSRFSKYETYVRTVARVYAFVDMCRRKATHVECRHVKRAEHTCLLQAQEDSFSEERRKLAAGHPILKGNPLFKLDPIMEEGLLRVRGRIEAATAPSDSKRPIIMDGRHPMTRLLVLKYHCAAGHAGRERVTNDLRQRFWVTRLRPTVRSIAKDCQFCRIRRARPSVPVTGDLPKARLEPFHRPFTNCGLDYFGPLVVKIGRRREKRWVALFTCLTVRAIHLEVVASLTTDSAIMALRRMAARRGWPKIIYSDNATNFKGADQELRSAYTEWAPQLREEGQLHRTEWKYIPPGAPNQGGAWERLVRSVKTALMATMNEKAPKEEVLNTLLAEAEFSINARPLTHVSVSPEDPEALTPNHFLLGSSTGMPTTGSTSEADRRTWRVSQALADQFWQRWLREYLPNLVPRGEARRDHPAIKEGDVVIIVDGALPRNTWPRGIVTRTYAGPDGIIRTADIRTRTGVFKRPARRIVVLRVEEGCASYAGGRMLRTTNALPTNAGKCSDAIGESLSEHTASPRPAARPDDGTPPRPSTALPATPASTPTRACYVTEEREGYCPDTLESRPHHRGRDRNIV